MRMARHPHAIGHAAGRELAAAARRHGLRAGGVVDAERLADAVHDEDLAAAGAGDEAEDRLVRVGLAVVAEGDGGPVERQLLAVGHQEHVLVEGLEDGAADGDGHGVARGRVGVVDAVQGVVGGVGRVGVGGGVRVRGFG